MESPYAIAALSYCSPLQPNAIVYKHEQTMHGIGVPTTYLESNKEQDLEDNSILVEN